LEIEKFKDNLKKNDASDIYKRFILGSDVWFFRKDGIKINEHYVIYDEFKVYLSKNLGIHTNDIAIVGSAKLGFSLAPDKDYRAFSETSDIDIVIVSSDIFRKSWTAFIELHKKNYLRGYKEVCSSVFRRFVSLKEPDTRNIFFDEWSRKVEPCKKDIQTLFSIPNEINYRIYESWESVETYHCMGLIEMKKKLERKNEKDN